MQQIGHLNFFDILEELQSKMQVQVYDRGDEAKEVKIVVTNYFMSKLSYHVS